MTRRHTPLAQRLFVDVAHIGLIDQDQLAPEQELHDLGSAARAHGKNAGLHLHPGRDAQGRHTGADDGADVTGGTITPGKEQEINAAALEGRCRQGRVAGARLRAWHMHDHRFQPQAAHDVAVGVADGEHDVDKSASKSSAGGEAGSTGVGGDRVWKESLDPSEQRAMKNFFNDGKK